MPFVCTSPAGQGAVFPHAAGVIVTGADRQEPTVGRGQNVIGFSPPALERTIRQYATFTELTRICGEEVAAGRTGLACLINSPTGNLAVYPDTAGEVFHGADGGESAPRWTGLTGVVQAPADNLPVGSQPPTVLSARSYIRASSCLVWAILSGGYFSPWAGFGTG